MDSLRRLGLRRQDVGVIVRQVFVFRYLFVIQGGGRNLILIVEYAHIPVIKI